MSRKRGKLSGEEEQFIMQNVHSKSIQDIADSLNRTVEPVKKFIKNNNIKSSEVINDEQYERNLLLKKLRERNYYHDLKGMLTDSELPRFEEDWIEVMLQFQGNVTYTEEIQIKQWILLQVLADRSMKSRKEAMEESLSLQKSIDREMELSEELRDMDLLNSLNQQLGFAREGMIAFTREHSQILDKLKDIEKSLKATREARVKKIEDSRSSWVGYLRMLEEEQKRRDAGDDAEIKKIAKDLAIERLAQWHKYEDGTVDQPLLSADTSLDEFDREHDDDED